MREIKFRAKSVDLPTRNEWVYGSFVEYPHDNIIVSIIDDGEGKRYAEHIVDVDTLGQFAGLHDRDGKGIYEGDIVMDCDDESPFAHELLKVNFDSGAFVACNELGDGLAVWCGSSFRVIGNIHDNPDLLKGGSPC